VDPPEFGDEIRAVGSALLARTAPELDPSRRRIARLHLESQRSFQGEAMRPFCLQQVPRQVFGHPQNPAGFDPHQQQSVDATGSAGSVDAGDGMSRCCRCPPEAPPGKTESHSDRSRGSRQTRKSWLHCLKRESGVMRGEIKIAHEPVRRFHGRDPRPGPALTAHARLRPALIFRTQRIIEKGRAKGLEIYALRRSIRSPDLHPP
jgi:hypothetical protein